MAAVLRVKKIDDDTYIDLPTPEILEWSISDLDSDEASGRNQNGQMLRDRIATKRKISCTWLPLNDKEMSTLLNAISDTFFTINYPDAITGTNREMMVYVGDRTTSIRRILKDGSTQWESVSFSFIER